MLDNHTCRGVGKWVARRIMGRYAVVIGSELEWGAVLTGKVGSDAAAGGTAGGEAGGIAAVWGDYRSGVVLELGFEVGVMPLKPRGAGWYLKL
jgi:hypothetical protein